jgi:hypothetical protein
MAFPPIKPTIAPKPVFHVVEQASIKLLASELGEFKVTTKARSMSKERSVRPKTVRKTNLKTGVRVLGE